MAGEQFTAPEAPAPMGPEQSVGSVQISAELLERMVYGAAGVPVELSNDALAAELAALDKTTVEELLTDPDSHFLAPVEDAFRTPGTYTMPSGDE